MLAYVLVVFIPGHSVATVPYPSFARCERAKQSIEAQDRESRDISRRLAQDQTANGVMTLPVETAVRAYCIPG